MSVFNCIVIVPKQENNDFIKLFMVLKWVLVNTQRQDLRKIVIAVSKFYDLFIQ